MKTEHWVILIGCLAWGSLYVLGIISHGVGRFLTTTFNGTIFEETGSGFTVFGDTAITAFWLILLMALIIVGVILYLKARASSSNYY
jgi:hypothetical protein